MQTRRQRRPRQGEEEFSFIKGFFDNNDTNKDGKITAEEWTENAKYMAQGRNSAFVLKPGGTGDITKSHVLWKETKGLPYVPSPLVYQGRFTRSICAASFQPANSRRARKSSWMKTSA